MDSRTVNPPSTGPPHGGHAMLQLQQPMDGPLSVGSGRVPQQPPSNGALDQHQVRELFSAGSGDFGAQPLQIHPPEVTLQHYGVASSPSLLSYGEMMIRCSQMMEQLLKQLLQLQQALSAMQSAMAAAPSSSNIEPVHLPQQQSEVMLTARCDQTRCPRSLSSEPHGSISTSQQIVSLAPSSMRAPASTEDGPRPAGETISDVTSDAHHPRVWFQPKPANPTSCKITEAPASTTAQNGTTADVIDRHRGQLAIHPASYAVYGAPQEELDRMKPVKIILDIYLSWSSSAKHGLAGASKISGELPYIFLHGPRPDQGKIENLIGQLPPWPPPTLPFCSPTYTTNKHRGGREDAQSILCAVSTLSKSMIAIVCALINLQRTRTETDPAASRNLQDVGHHRFPAGAAVSFQESLTAEQPSTPPVALLCCSFEPLFSSSSPSPSASRLQRVRRSQPPLFSWYAYPVRDHPSDSTATSLFKRGDVMDRTIV